MIPYTRLHAACAAMGTILFTVTQNDFAAMLARRAYTSHPVEYPAHGTKPLTRDAWFDLCITRAQPFVANTPEAFRDHFFDHALITSMGLGSAANLPVVAPDGSVPGSINLLAEPGHFTPDRLRAYQSAVDREHGALLAAMAA